MRIVAIILCGNEDPFLNVQALSTIYPDYTAIIVP
jgi:hypothetical protein